MKHIVCGICRATGLITTREVEAADAVVAAAIASGDLIVFEVDPAEGERACLPAAAPALALSPIGDTARRLSFVCSMLILAGLFAWSAHETAPAGQPVGPGAQAVVALPSHVPATHPASLPPLARAAAPPVEPAPAVETASPVVPATPVTLTH